MKKGYAVITRYWKNEVVIGYFWVGGCGESKVTDEQARLMAEETAKQAVESERDQTFLVAKIVSEFYNPSECRCTAIPILPELDELDELEEGGDEG